MMRDIGAVRMSNARWPTFTVGLTTNKPFLVWNQKGPVNTYYLVAGAGFEPATFGL
jgi:hypothetical protein